MKVKNTFLLLFIFLLFLSTKLFANADFRLHSPDNKIEVNITAGKAGVFYSVKVDNQQIVNSSGLNIQLQDGLNICTGAVLTGQVRHSNNSIWENRLGKTRYISDHYNEITLHLQQPQNKLPFDIVFRAYNDGIAFRYRFSKLSGADTLKIHTESSQFNFANDYAAYMGYNQGYTFGGPQEWEFKNRKLSTIKPDSVVGLPLVIKTPAAWVAIAEADLLDWSGMWITADTNKGGTSTKLVSSLAPHIQKAGCVDVTTPHSSPWRVLMIGRDAGKLIESNIIVNLSTPSLIGDASWVKPGISAWDHWWSGGTIMTTAVIKQYIQLAADMHWPYQLIDWQWYHAFNTPDADITEVNPALNMNEVLNFAKQKGVRLWVWLYWKDVDKNDAYKKAFALYEKWGLAGVKIDFMERDDQEMVNWYEKITKCAAEHHLMVDFHGAYKPTGL
ncbi:MAG: glycoside hydrolase family 97 N-terminal domain-containing protein, partial [Mucilaginibacter sp.]